MLVNNAGVFGLAPIDEIERDDLQRFVEVNLFGPVYVTQEAACLGMGRACPLVHPHAPHQRHIEHLPQTRLLAADDLDELHAALYRAFPEG